MPNESGECFRAVGNENGYTYSHTRVHMLQLSSLTSTCESGRVFTLKDMEPHWHDPVYTVESVPPCCSFGSSSTCAIIRALGSSMGFSWTAAVVLMILFRKMRPHEVGRCCEEDAHSLDFVRLDVEGVYAEDTPYLEETGATAFQSARTRRYQRAARTTWVSRLWQVDPPEVQPCACRKVLFHTNYKTT